MSLFRKKPLSTLLAQIEDSGGLKRTLRWPGLIALGIGAVIGAGLFARTPAAAAQNAGPGVILSFVIAATGCAFAGLCYAEFAAMIPIAGSAYTYAYVTMGELVAWIIGWALILRVRSGCRHSLHLLDRILQQPVPRSHSLGMEALASADQPRWDPRHHQRSGAGDFVVDDVAAYQGHLRISND
jgi:hypothetical protein